MIFATGAFWFGVVIGYITYRTLHHAQRSSVADIGTVIAAIGGGAVLALFPAASERFDDYAFGLAAGFFVYLALSLLIGLTRGAEVAKQVLGGTLADAAAPVLSAKKPTL